MKQITLTAADCYTGPLMLVNASHPLANGTPGAQSLSLLGAAPGGEQVFLDRQAAKMMHQLLGASSGAGEILPVSGYRSHAEQQAIFEETLREKGEAFTRSYVALPGCSEHETGLALDVTSAAEPYDFICPSFPNAGLFARFRRLAALYGFVERYPKGKSDITGIAHEPWHFRYVGWPHARTMQENGWTLEEYIETLAHYTAPQHALVRQEREYAICSFTVALAPGEEKTLELPETVVWQLSGNNAGGVVVSLWK